MVRPLLRKVLLTSNTIRYRIEYRVLRAMLEQHVGPVNTLADLGAGSGEMSRLLHHEGLATHLIGIEPFADNYGQLVKNYASIRGAVTHQAGLEKIPLPDDSVDLALSTQVFEHIEDDCAAAAEATRIVRPGGHLLISTPHPPELFPNDGHVRPGYTEEGMAALFSPFGAELIASDYFFTLSTLRRMIAARELPAEGRFLPPSWADREAGLSRDDRRSQQPYGIACLFQLVS